MDLAQIKKMVSEYAHKSSYGTEPYFQEIKSLGEKVIPFFIEAYPSAKHWQQRASYLYRAVSYARSSSQAQDLAIMALNDKSKEVCYRACMLLACSLNPNVVPALRVAQNTATSETALDIAAAIDAIESQNHNYFIDRTHSGKIMLNFQGK